MNNCSCVSEPGDDYYCRAHGGDGSLADLRGRWRRMADFSTLHPQNARDIGNVLAREGYFKYGDMLHRYASAIEETLKNISKREAQYNKSVNATADTPQSTQDKSITG